MWRTVQAMTHPQARRLDRRLVEDGLSRARATARELIVAGVVEVDGEVVTKPSHPVRRDARICVRDDGPNWVGRGAEKLSAAMEQWPSLREQVKGARCVDVGASTGGFTQVMLRHGAAHVVAIDVGTGQLAGLLAEDKRVEDRSGTHVLDVAASDLTGPLALIVVDLWFISVRQVLQHLTSWCTEETSIVILVKPQFEVGKDALGRGGIVRSADSRARVLGEVVDAAYVAGLALRGGMTSPITGARGNVEYLLWVERGREGMMDRGAARDLTRTVT
ncbi:MAG: TlyA family RNA methyltransferase [Ornithinimicrobium sp.]